MEICLGKIHGKPVMLELKDGVAYINGDPQPIKNLTEKDLQLFNEEMAALKKTDDPEAAEALENSVRAAFLANLLGKCAGDECITLVSHILDHVHYDVLKYLGEVEE